VVRVGQGTTSVVVQIISQGTNGKGGAICAEQSLAAGEVMLAGVVVQAVGFM
jgi:hypothetical protein